MKITILGAGSSVFLQNVMGDCLLCEALREAEFALYDIDPQRLKDSEIIANHLSKALVDGKAKITTYLGVENRKEALRGARFVLNTVQVGGYDPCTIIDFEVPKKYGLRQTIGDTLGIGGIFRALRTIPVVRDFARDMEEVCPDAWLLNYTNPMAMLAGYLQRYTGVKTVGLCHSVQICTHYMFKGLGMTEYMDKNCIETIAGINHMAWVLEVRDKDGNDLYPEVRRRAKHRNATEVHKNMVRYDYIDKFGYYCTESSVHNAEYNPFYIKPGREDLLEKFNITLDEYPRRCINQIKEWNELRDSLLRGEGIEHTRSNEYASHILEAMVLDKPYKIGGNVINNGLITNLPREACVEVPCMVDANGVTPMFVGDLPLQLAAMNASNIYPQLLTIEAAHTGKRQTIYQAAMMDPHTGAVLSTDEIVAMCDELIEAHTNAGFPIRAD